MGKTFLSIRMDYMKAMAQAKQLDTLAEELAACLREAQGSRARVIAGWKGEDVNAYLAKLDAAIERLTRYRKNVIGISETVRRIAKRTYDSEMRALEISQQRSYH